MATVRIDARMPELFRRMRTAMLAPATGNDQILVAGEWRQRDEVMPCDSVEQVTIVGRQTFAPDDLIEVYESEERIAWMKVLAIRLVSIADLTDDELFALGFEERADTLNGVGTLVMDGTA